MNYTSIEQSKKLLELGLSPDTADMYYPYDDIATYPNIIDGLENEYSIPCWTAEALMKVISEDFTLKSYIDNTYRCFIRNPYVPMFRDSILDTVYDAVCWLLENNYITKNK